MTPYRKFWLALFIAGILVVSLLVAYMRAAGPMMAPSPPRIGSITIQPVTAVDGSFVAFNVTAAIIVAEYQPSGQVDAHELGSVSVDLARSNGSVVVAGEMLDDREAMDHLAAIVLREWRKTMPEPLPVTRRARRSQ